MLNNVSCGAGVNEGTGVANLSKRTMIEENSVFHRLRASTSYKNFSHMGGRSH